MEREEQSDNPFTESFLSEQTEPSLRVPRLVRNLEPRDRVTFAAEMRELIFPGYERNLSDEEMMILAFHIDSAIKGWELSVIAAQELRRRSEQ